MPLGHVGVIGGGINGLCIALELAKRGWSVELFERERCLQQTSTASTKLLHGGLRYIEHGHLALVAESLRERARWLRDVPEYAHWLPLLLPVYRKQCRAAWQWRAGLGWMTAWLLVNCQALRVGSAHNNFLRSTQSSP